MLEDLDGLGGLELVLRREVKRLIVGSRRNVALVVGHDVGAVGLMVFPG